MNDDAAGQGPHERPVVPLLARLRAMEDLRRLEGDEDEAELCREVAEELHNLAWALSLPGFDRMATDEQEAEHQAGVQRVNDVLAEMERRKAEHDSMVRDAGRYRWLRDRCAWTMCSASGMVRLAYRLPIDFRHDDETADEMDQAVDEAMKRHNVLVTGQPLAGPVD